MGYLCKYLSLYGWEPTVVTEAIDDETFLHLSCHALKDIHTVRVQYYSRRGGIGGKMIRGLQFVAHCCFGEKQKKYYKEALQCAATQQFDVILCSSFRLFPLPAALRLAPKKNLPLVVDLRDIIEQYTGHEFITRPILAPLFIKKPLIALFRTQSIRKRNHVLRAAAAVTTVSPWHVEQLHAVNPATHLIYNGYDPELFFPAHVATEQFQITYTGRLLSTAMRNPTLLFEAVQQVDKEGTIAPDTFRLKWYTDRASVEILEKEIARFPTAAAYMDYHAYKAADEVPRLLQESSILLLLTNKADEKCPNGNITTKFFEALAVRKPILFVLGDEVCLEEKICKTASGLSAHNAEEV